MSFLRMLMAPLLVLDREPTEAKRLLELLGSKRTRLRRKGMAALAQQLPATGDRYLPELLDGLLDRDEEVRASAAHLLGQMGPKAALAVPALTRALADEDPEVRLASAYALGHIGATEHSVVPALLRQRLDDDGDIRVAVIQALGALGPYAKEATTELLTTLQSQHWRERWAAAIALGQMGQTRALPHLHQRFYRDADEQVREAILDAIATLGLGDVAWVSVFLDGLEDTAEEVRLQAVQSLALWGPKASAATGPLSQMLEREYDYQIRPAILHALGKIQHQKAIPIIRQALEELEVDFAFAIEGFMALGRIGGPTAAEALLDAKDDPEPALRGRVALALGHAQERSSEVVHALQSMTQDREKGVQLQATQALARLEQPAFPMLRDMAESAAFWAARHISIATHSLPISDDAIDDAIMLIPGPEEANDALDELHFAIQWLKRECHALWDDGHDTDTMRQQCRQQIDAALHYIQYQPLAPPHDPQTKRIRSLQLELRQLQEYLQHDRDPVESWQTHLETALFD